MWQSSHPRRSRIAGAGCCLGVGWMSGLYGAASVPGGIRIERTDYVPFRVAD